MNKQTIKRIWHSFRLFTIMNSGKRADYLRNHKVFHHIGVNCTIVERKVPLYSKLISLGDNVHLASKVLLVTHDAIHLCLNNIEKRSGSDDRFQEKIGCIEIGNDVFIGSNSTVLSDVRIGSRVIVGAGSLVNKDIPDNSVVVGVPARVIGTFDDFVTKRRFQQLSAYNFKSGGQSISEELERLCWDNMENRGQL